MLFATVTESKLGHQATLFQYCSDFSYFSVLEGKTILVSWFKDKYILRTLGSFLTKCVSLSTVYSLHEVTIHCSAACFHCSSHTFVSSRVYCQRSQPHILVSTHHWGMGSFLSCISNPLQGHIPTLLEAVRWLNGKLIHKYNFTFSLLHTHSIKTIL